MADLRWARRRPTRYKAYNANNNTAPAIFYIQDALIGLGVVDGDTMKVAQMLERSQTIKRGARNRQN
jgi:hypothetical protein